MTSNQIYGWHQVYQRILLNSKIKPATYSLMVRNLTNNIAYNVKHTTVKPQKRDTFTQIPLDLQDEINTQ